MSSPILMTILRRNDFLRYLERRLLVVRGVIPEETLIIFDEIQSSERALTALKYFCEETPEYHIAAQGVCWVAINRQHYSFPVGKVGPLRSIRWILREYLGARSQKLLSEEIQSLRENGTAALMHCIRKAIELYRNICLSAGCRPVSTPF